MNTLRLIGLAIGYLAVVLLICQLVEAKRAQRREAGPANRDSVINGASSQKT